MNIAQPSNAVAASPKFIKIHLKDGVTDESISQSGTLCLEYNSDGETYFNKSSVFSFNIDEKTFTINIVFCITMDGFPYRSTLRFTTKGGEFQRIKRELTE